MVQGSAGGIDPQGARPTLGVAITAVSALATLPTRPPVSAVTLHRVTNFLRASHQFSPAEPHALEAFALSYCRSLAKSTLEGYVHFAKEIEKLLGCDMAFWVDMQEC